MDIDNVQVQTAIGIDGNTITTSISNDKLTNEDFLKLLLEELKMQDPTKPMDSQRMLQDQLQMSQIQTNLDTSNAMKSMEESFFQTALANSANLIRKVVEDGSVNDQGVASGYYVKSVEVIDGEIYLNTSEVLSINDDGSFNLSETSKKIPLSNVTSVVG